jgi:hypothetical protein
VAVTSRQGELQEAVAAAIAEQAREAIPASGFAVGAQLYERALLRNRDTEAWRMPRRNDGPYRSHV